MSDPAPPTTELVSCRNCEATGVQRFCPACGQRHIEHRVSFWILAGEFAGEFFSVDSRIGRSVVPFLFRPGFLAREFNEGRRVHYSSPLRLMLFAVLLFVTTTAISLSVEFAEEPSKAPVAQTEDGEEESIAVVLLKQIEAQQAGLPDSDGLRARLLAHTHERVEELRGLPPRTAARETRNALVGQFPKVAFIVVPLLAILLQLLYVRQRWFFVEHLVFSTHFAAIALTLFALQTLIAVPGFALLSTLAHCVLGLRCMYQQSWGWTVLKSLVVLVVLIVLVSLLSVAAVVVGLMLG